jgi:hypothetical protein
MKTQNKAVTHVLNSLSAVRVTFSDEERAILDEILTGVKEVEAHQMKGKLTNGKLTHNTSDAENEVEAHQMKGKLTNNKLTNGKLTHNASDAENEVEAHQMKAKLTNGKLSNGQITFDEASGKYVYVE